MTRLLTILIGSSALALTFTMSAGAQSNAAAELLHTVKQDAQADPEATPPKNGPENPNADGSLESSPNDKSIDELFDKLEDPRSKEDEAPSDPDAEGGDIPEAPEIVVPAEKPELKTENKDLTIRSEADRKAKLDELFKNLHEQETEQEAELVAEEIWAVFLQSRSATVDFMLLRGIAAHKNGDLTLARRMFDHVTRLQPEYAEGWSRSGRLAVDEKDLSRAANDVAKSLVIEPRHFYALWTLGNILETLGRSDAAFEAYSEAAKLYPQHKQINERLEYLRAGVEGQTL